MPGFPGDAFLKKIFRSRKVWFVYLLLVIAAPVTSVSILVFSLVDHVVAQVPHIDLNHSLRASIDALVPVVQAAVIPVVILLVLAAFSMFFWFISLSFSIATKASGVIIGPKDAWGITVKAWVFQVPVLCVGIVVTVFVVVPELLNALFAAQVDAGNNIVIGRLLRDLLAVNSTWFLILGAASVPFHAWSVRILDEHANRHGMRPSGVRQAYFTGMLVIGAILLVLLVIVLLVLFMPFSVISIENNPLQ